MTGILGQLKWESLKIRRKDSRLILLYFCYIIGQIVHCLGDNFNNIHIRRGRLVHLFKWGDYRKAQLSQPRALPHLPLEIRYLYFNKTKSYFIRIFLTETCELNLSTVCL